MDAASELRGSDPYKFIRTHRTLIHPRNRLKREPDFSALANQYPELKPFVKMRKNGKCRLDFTKIDSQIALTTVLFKEFFQLDVVLPPNKLIPALTVRANYIHWIEDILEASQLDFQAVRGFDIGVGASCVYPLLALRLHPTWRFAGSEVQPDSFQYASANVTRNELQDAIELRLVPPMQSTATNPSANTATAAASADKISQPHFPILQGVIGPSERFTFTMCNPPFFDLFPDASQRSRKTVCTGDSQEMVCEGGEAGFVARMIEDSRALADQVTWFTTMLGKKASLRRVMAHLCTLPSPTCVLRTEFLQGRTTRWGIAWSFSHSLPTVLTADPQLNQYRYCATSPSSTYSSLPLPTIPPQCHSPEIATEDEPPPKRQCLELPSSSPQECSHVDSPLHLLRPLPLTKDGKKQPNSKQRSKKVVEVAVCGSVAAVEAVFRPLILLPPLTRAFSPLGLHIVADVVVAAEKGIHLGGKITVSMKCTPEGNTQELPEAPPPPSSSLPSSSPPLPQCRVMLERMDGSHSLFDSFAGTFFAQLKR